jgi:FHA domain/DUF1707 SHOCT-like domain
MTGSAAEAPTTPDAEPVGHLRASDAERDEVLARLREEFVAGRLSQNTFLFRLDAVLQARHVSDLSPLLADLEPAVPAVPAVPEPAVDRPAVAGLVPSPLELPGPAPFPPAGQPALTGRLRAALDRCFRPGVPASAAAAPRTARPASGTALPGRLSAALRLMGGRPHPRQADVPARPLPLQFPRGSGTFFSIGRADGCDMAIGDMTVSRVHARLERTTDGWVLADLGSTNGTRVNGWRVREKVPVTAGDLVSFGRAEFWLTAPDGVQKGTP